MKIHIQYIVRDDSMVGEHAGFAASDTDEVSIPRWNRANVIKACGKLADWDEERITEALDEDSDEYFYSELNYGNSSRNNVIFADSHFFATFNVVQVN